MSQSNTPPVNAAVERIELPNGYYFKNLGQGFWGMFTPDDCRMGNNTLWTTSIVKDFAAAMQNPTPLERDGLHHPKIDSQVMLAASEISDVDKHIQPEWLWWNHESQPNSVPTFGRWSKIMGGVPYIRADLFLEALAAHQPQPASEVLPDDEATNMARQLADEINKAHGCRIEYDVLQTISLYFIRYAAAHTSQLTARVGELTKFVHKCALTSDGKGYYKDENPQYDGKPSESDIIDLIGTDAEKLITKNNKETPHA